MFNAKDMYTIYKKYYTDKQLVKEQEFRNIKNARTRLIAALEERIDFFDHCNVSLNKALTLRDERTAISFTGKVPIELQKVLKQTIKDLMYANKAYTRLSVAIAEFKNILVDYPTFSTILKIYNKTKIKLLITKGYSWNLGNGLGSLFVVLKRIPVKTSKEGKVLIRPNWPESKKKKQALLDAGEVPYCKNTAPNGKPWLVAFTDEVQAYFEWRGFNKRYVANIGDMCFRPTQGANGICLKLSQYRKNNPEVDRYYVDNINQNINKKHKINK